MWRTPSTPETASSIVRVTLVSSSAGADAELRHCDGHHRHIDVRHARDGQLVKAQQSKRDDCAPPMTIGGSGFRIDHAEKLIAIVPPGQSPAARHARGVLNWAPLNSFKRNSIEDKEPAPEKEMPRL